MCVFMCVFTHVSYLCSLHVLLCAFLCFFLKLLSVQSAVAYNIIHKLINKADPSLVILKTRFRDNRTDLKGPTSGLTKKSKNKHDILDVSLLIVR